MNAAERWSRLRVLDGGFGTELEKAGLRLKDDVLWSAAALIDNPELVVEIHKRYISAGCDVILTNSYHANIENIISSRKMDRKCAELVVQKSVELCREAVESLHSVTKHPVEIVGSVGPYATTLFDCSEYNGHYVDEVPEMALIAHHIRQAIPLLDAGLKMLAFETVPANKEVCAILKALDSLPDDTRCWISMACRNGALTNHGDRFSEAACLAFAHKKVVAFGVNCTCPEFVSPLLRSAQEFSNKKPFIVYPNSGEIYDKESKSWIQPKNMPSLESYAQEWSELGVRLIGGCCRVSPQMIQSLACAVTTLS